MDKNRVADILEEIAMLLEFRGESPFKCRAYENAARTIRGLDRGLRDLVREGRLRDLKGIGEALSEKIATLVTTGRLPYLEELRGALPSAAREILKIPGLGPRKAGILIDLPGFGSKTQERVLKGIERVEQYRGQILLGDALPLGAAAFALLPQVRTIRLQEEARVSAVLEGEVPVNLRIVPDDDYACALLHRLDLDTAACRLGRSLGARFAIDPDSHNEAGLTDRRYGVGVARRAGLGPADILNTAAAGRLDQALRRTR